MGLSWKGGTLDELGNIRQAGYEKTKMIISSNNSNLYFFMAKQTQMLIVLCTRKIKR